MIGVWSIAMMALAAGGQYPRALWGRLVLSTSSIFHLGFVVLCKWKTGDLFNI